MNLSFLEDDLERTLALWHDRLKEEEEDNMSLSLAIYKDDYIEDASSKAAPKGASSLDAEIDAMLGDDVVAEDRVPQSEEHVEAARQEIIQIVRETLAEVDPTDQTPPSLGVNKKTENPPNPTDPNQPDPKNPKNLKNMSFRVKSDPIRKVRVRVRV